jgi:hypothetical protein
LYINRAGRESETRRLNVHMQTSCRLSTTCPPCPCFLQFLPRFRTLSAKLFTSIKAPVLGARFPPSLAGVDLFMDHHILYQLPLSSNGTVKSKVVGSQLNSGWIPLSNHYEVSFAGRVVSNYLAVDGLQPLDLATV